MAEGRWWDDVVGGMHDNDRAVVRCYRAERAGRRWAWWPPLLTLPYYAAGYWWLFAATAAVCWGGWLAYYTIEWRRNVDACNAWAAEYNLNAKERGTPVKRMPRPKHR